MNANKYFDEWFGAELSDQAKMENQIFMSHAIRFAEDYATSREQEAWNAAKNKIVKFDADGAGKWVDSYETIED